MTSSSSFILNVDDNNLKWPESSWNAEYFEVLNNFKFDKYYNDELCYSVKLQFQLKSKAFDALQRQHYKMFHEEIVEILRYKENDDDILVSTDMCAHHLIEKISKIVKTIESMSNVDDQYRYCMFVFVPYAKQLLTILECFKNDYCCKNVVQQSLEYLQKLLQDSRQTFETLKTIHERIKTVNVFFDYPKIYECNICQETSVERQFLKPNVCCGFNICGMCYAQLWQHCNLYPVCPVCKTSFKSISTTVEIKH
ncbi:ie-0 [Ectropis obliqua nucleopolyhedrovirus]|uniref:Ie-0 n=1 Tax=Ectropis obliqua nucleopolyhedrovirus TaxID=59376 RepID=A0EYR5_9ABAC|nr:ie-0 [Ectropis obliqua nucleopolyhedrovirus]ABI35696.1 ie-0 [Ectropis obliqua nucleopolyhedrovirus]AGS47877.1 immediate-early protein IE-0 [Ectropis obliqua nucleopolyhedrovirus]QWV59598.1 ie-0 [Ectropis obliqua nucleopolyhedrovirus]UYO72804.1 ie-0 [Ectropis obliqua nucleopolyhedrovirus]